VPSPEDKSTWWRGRADAETMIVVQSCGQHALNKSALHFRLCTQRCVKIAGDVA